MKTQVLNHRVPITDDVAAIVQTVIECIKKQSNMDNNPKNSYSFDFLVNEKVVRQNLVEFKTV